MGGQGGRAPGRAVGPVSRLRRSPRRKGTFSGNICGSNRKIPSKGPNPSGSKDGSGSKPFIRMGMLQRVTKSKQVKSK